MMMSKKIMGSLAAIVFVAASIAASTVAFSQHSVHSYTKVSEARDSSGQTVCTWKCLMGGGHFATTTGYGYCSRPY
jgi:hypothetical protein